MSHILRETINSQISHLLELKQKFQKELRKAVYHPKDLYAQQRFHKFCREELLNISKSLRKRFQPIARILIRQKIYTRRLVENNNGVCC